MALEWWIAFKRDEKQLERLVTAVDHADRAWLEHTTLKRYLSRHANPCCTSHQFLYVRIPNETVIKSEVTTLTKFTIRPIDLQLGVAYKEDISKVRDLLFRIAESNPLSLEEPKPLFIFLGFGDSAVNLQFLL